MNGTKYKTFSHKIRLENGDDIRFFGIKRGWRTCLLMAKYKPKDEAVVDKFFQSIEFLSFQKGKLQQVAIKEDSVQLYWPVPVVPKYQYEDVSSTDEASGVDYTYFRNTNAYIYTADMKAYLKEVCGLHGGTKLLNESFRELDGL